MTKHIPRKDRWSSYGPNEHRCAWGRVYYRNGQWRAQVKYQVTEPGSAAPGDVETWDAGGFKRPRNAMLALEEKVLLLQRHHGENIRFLVEQ